ncbi:MAG TPA: gamma-glutamyl-gamma-aminobutyrate hydrolase family protein [Bacteroidales bacterium]|nr:gamma-glutamyl-gamma-aminobutyrate hydrolase family protein [Bacteroidales bacterium]HRX95719.1 gamma-glutamyl-gamma-aminobutyrate hydrolase family protein [Bacteroidales bacterium]
MRIRLIIIFAASVFLLSCERKTAIREPLRIAVSKATPNDNSNSYFNWLWALDSTVQVEEMYHYNNLDSAILILQNCDGLLLTGGTDIYPGKYGKESDTARCWDPDFKRDTLEALLINKAIEYNLPILGICRGHQNLNVYFGGTLYIDIPTDFDTTVNHRVEDGYACYHELILAEGSLLESISGIHQGEVNSAHHQAVEIVADDLIPIAYAPDGLIESITYKDTTGKPFLLGVQWHPERLDFNNPLSGNIGRYFLNEVRKTKK